MYHGNNRIGVGVTRPILVTADNGKKYVAKLFDEDNEHKHLVNEYISYHLAKDLDLPIPDASFLIIPETLIASNPDLKERNIKSNIAFGSHYIGTAIPNINSFLLDSSKNTRDFPAILLFDQIIYNDDRSENAGNLIFCKKSKKLLIIDHSHIFKDGTIWSVSSLNRCINELIVPTFLGTYNKMLLKYVNGNRPFHYISQKIQAVSQERILEIVSSIPDEWPVTRDEKETLVSFIFKRIQALNEIIDQIKLQWPHFHN